MPDHTPLTIIDWNPLLVGQNWVNYQGASAFSVLVRLARLNFLRSGDIHKALGVMVRKYVDVFGLTCRYGPGPKAMALTQNFPPDFAEGWSPSFWWPYANEMPLDAIDWRLRVCPKCIKFAYHSLLFQMPGAFICPWHRCPLVNTCTTCNKPLLDGFQRGLRLLQCGCGSDLINHSLLVIGDSESVDARRSIIDRHVRLASTNRENRWLISPEVFDPEARPVIHALTGVPSWQPCDHSNLVFDTIRCKDSFPTELKPNSGLDKLNHTMARIPTRWAHGCAAIWRHLSMMMPSGSLSGAERKALYPASSPESDSDRRQSRPWVLGLPGYSAGKDTFVHTMPIDGVALRVLGKLVCSLSQTDDVPGAPEGIGEFRAWQEGNDQVKRVVEATAQRVFLRSYADGCRVLLGHLHPDLYACRRTRPARRFPWIHLELGHQAVGRIVWTRQRLN